MSQRQSKDLAVYAGADISKDSIDISYHFGNKLIIDKIANNDQAIRKFVKTALRQKRRVNDGEVSCLSLRRR